ncbi:hypothetical protein CVT91_05510 [Candidatus Atribacteria bacterium HGW-Atribacteria-1]|nr:MAG: hypothetical protein CVT91_05510 [Candidatus Atribacteria bacterium HGW-Atribacteria-1]
MPLLSQKEVLNLKLSCIKAPQLRILASNFGLTGKGSASETIKRVLESHPDEKIIDAFIKQKYTETIQERRTIISDEDLKKELRKVKTFSWGVVQGQLDQKIQTEYVRRIVRYEDLVNNVKAKLHDDVTNYVICTWFNHWTTVLIEEYISTHPKIIPTIKNIKGIDIFYDGQPFDLKVTYLPREYNSIDAVRNPSNLAVWMYENQGAQRFGSDNRLFVVLLDKDNPERSWELKRDFTLVFQKIDNFFDRELVSKKDEIIFTFGRKTYTAVTKVLIITK